MRFSSPLRLAKQPLTTTLMPWLFCVASLVYADPEKGRAASRDYYYRNTEKRKADARKWEQENPEKAKAAKRAHEARNLDKAAARERARYALATGKLERQPCARASEGGCSDLMHMHHPDYTKPLEVVWLCSTHHGLEHRCG